MRSDDVLKVRLDLRDIRMSVAASDEKATGANAAVDLDELIGSEEKAEAEIAAELIHQGANVVDAGQEPSRCGDDEVDAEEELVNRNPTLKRENTSVRAEEDAEKTRDQKRRKLRLLASEKRILGNVYRSKDCGSSRRKLNAMLNALEFGDKALHDRKWDISNIIGAMEKEEPTPHDESEELDRLRAMYENVYFMDDMNGNKILDKEMVIQARQLEMQYFRKMQVYEKVPRGEAKQKGCKIITTRWLDTNKGDDVEPNYRSRLVGREMKFDRRLDLFSATPPLEALKMLIAHCARNQTGSKPCRLAAIDIKRAYFFMRPRGGQCTLRYRPKIDATGTKG